MLTVHWLTDFGKRYGNIHHSRYGSCAAQTRETSVDTKVVLETEDGKTLLDPLELSPSHVLELDSETASSYPDDINSYASSTVL